MYVASVGINNYKSFNLLPAVGLLPGLNAIVGENNTGKSSLMEAIGMRFQNKPHRSSATYHGAYVRPTDTSIVIVRFALERDELIAALCSISPFSYSYQTSTDPLESFRIGGGLSILNCTYTGGHSAQSVVPGTPAAQWVPAKLFRSFLEFLPSIPIGRESCLLSVDDAGRVAVEQAGPSVGTPPGDYGIGLEKFARASVYAFQAERYNLGNSAAGNNHILSPDASNLAEVLSVMQMQPSQWTEFNRYVRAVFPQIYDLSVGPAQNNRVEILIWNEPSKGLARELAIAVSESGSGVGQVLAILAVVVMSDYPRTIIVDEPQSFLHPGALRALVQILADHPQHQFIIATHSPTVITAASPAQILKVTRDGAVSQIQRLDAMRNEDLRSFLTDIGARLSDVFGAERILWVDGATEELCFPEIVATLAKVRRFGTKILGVLHTGDFERPDARTVFQSYQRLSSGGGLLPPAVGFLFDRETRTASEMADLKREAAGLVDFLPRRMYENFLLHPKHIATVMNECSGFRQAPVESAEITAQIQIYQGEGRFLNPKLKGCGEAVWLENVDAARLLIALFTEFSETRCVYRKTDHGLKLTRLILAEAPENFGAIALQIETVLEQSSSLRQELIRAGPPGRSNPR